jgi:hypothetical protein
MSAEALMRASFEEGGPRGKQGFPCGSEPNASDA